MKIHAPKSGRSPRRIAHSTALLALALGSQAGCGREFFREWANHDVSEAIFEKSRDPRWRLDMFSIDPPALSRFADPYDPDRPPAPPDDFAAQALSPVPQWPDNRLITPVEGTGYLDMLEAWQRERPQPAAAPPTPATPATPGATGTPPPAPPPDAPSPFRPAPEATPSPEATPNPEAAPSPEANPEMAPPPPVPEPSPPEPPSPAVPEPSTTTPLDPPAPRPDGPQAKAGLRDPGLRRVAAQETPSPAQETPSPAQETPSPAQETPSPAQETPGSPRVAPNLGVEPMRGSDLPLTQPDVRGGRTPFLPTPPIGMDPDPSNPDLSAPVDTRPGLPSEEFRASQAEGAELSGLLQTEKVDVNEAEAAGLPSTSRPYVVTIEQAFKLALINSRVYQFRLEQMYITSLALTLQRFNFEPQFVAGLSPQTQTSGGGLAVNPPNSFLYRTRETGNPASILNLGTVAGVGKLLSGGGQILASFASQLVFDFAGPTPRQPSVRSFLPLSFVQPFLRGGGRAVTLELLTQAERDLLYDIRSFARFRQEFVVATLVGGQGFSDSPGDDPNIGFLSVLQLLQTVENDLKNVAAFEQLYKVYQELIEGASSGLSQLQVDQIDSNLQQARQGLVADRTLYRNNLEQYRMQLGLPPDVPLTLDRRLTASFKQVFDEIDDWSIDVKRELTDLPRIVSALPKLEDVLIDGRSIQGIYRDGNNNEAGLEDLLQAGVRVALENRLDLMNARAALEDSWRQIKFTANGLLGGFNIAITNQFVTPPNTTNPFAFVDQAKQFQLVFNAELPLVRMVDRNRFRTALLLYQRQRRALQGTEDDLKFQIRQDIRNVQQQYLIYEISKRNFVSQVRQKDQSFELVIAPPEGSGGSTQGAVQTQNLINSQSGILRLENTLVLNWLNYQRARFNLYRDLGTLPYDEWEAYYELFPAKSDRPGPGGPPLGAQPAGVAAARPAPGARP